jgi:cellulose biosynthesis protein BcsQ
LPHTGKREEAQNSAQTAAVHPTPATGFDALQTAAQNSGIRLFNTYIPETVRFKESPRYKAPLVVEQPNHEGAKAYMTVVEQIING